MRSFGDCLPLGCIIPYASIKLWLFGCPCIKQSTGEMTSKITTILPRIKRYLTSNIKNHDEMSSPLTHFQTCFFFWVFVFKIEDSWRNRENAGNLRGLTIFKECAPKIFPVCPKSCYLLCLPRPIHYLPHGLGFHHLGSHHISNSRMLIHKRKMEIVSAGHSVSVLE